MEQCIFFYTTSLSLIFIVIFTFKFFLQTKRLRYTNLLPSPLSLPVLGHLHLVKPSPTNLPPPLPKTRPDFLSLVRLPARGHSFILVRCAVQECFTKNDIVSANRPPLFLGKHLGCNNTTIATCPHGDQWRNLRRIGTIAIFPSARLNAFSDARKDQVKHLIRKLSQNLIHGFAKVELKSMFSELTFNIIMTMVAGKRYYGNGDDVSVDKEEAGHFRQIMKEVIAHSRAANPADYEGGFTRSD